VGLKERTSWKKKNEKRDTWNSIEDTIVFSSRTVPQFTQIDWPPASWKSISLEPHLEHFILFFLVSLSIFHSVSF
jgi:hypothetical protein